MLLRIKYLIIMTMMSLVSWAQEPMLIENFAKHTSAEYNVMQNGKMGIMLNINARAVMLYGKNIEIGMLFFSNTKMGNDGNPVVVGVERNTYNVTSSDKSFTGINLFVPYQDYIFDCHGVCYIKNITDDKIVYLNFNDLFRPETNKIHFRSNANESKYVFKATQYATKNTDWAPCNIILIQNFSKNQFEIRWDSESMFFRLTDKKDHGADQELETNVTFYAVDSDGDTYTIKVEFERRGNRFITINGPELGIIFKVDFAN